MSHWRLPQQLVGHPPPLAAGSLVFSPLRKAKGGKLGAQGAWRLCRRQGALRGHLEVWASCHRLPPTVTPETQTSPCRHTLWAPQRHTGTHTDTQTPTHWGTMALPCPSRLPSRPRLALDPTHLEPTRSSKQGLETQSRLRLAMERPWMVLAASGAQA